MRTRSLSDGYGDGGGLSYMLSWHARMPIAFVPAKRGMILRVA